MVNFSRMAASPSGGLGGSKHVVGMAIDFHMAPDPDDFTVRSDQNRGAKDTHEGLPYMDFSPQAP